ncbi:cation:proton antiporter [Marinoscillum sp. MHG1-6]|uniref:cation:proton antiporter domain-containing protein n=1 Tax=Marinoscillum sp. MHG1-6 TaxID=2959627 RepID=UPI0021589457|nr:cation:proton antiporter [Marinoscillum sp. MHG1-6]
MHDINYWPLFIIIVIAWMVPLVLSWLEIGKLPSVIVEIIIGVLVGPFALDLIDETPYMDFLAITGFLFLIFLAGLEVDVSKIIASIPRKRPRVIDLVSNSMLLAIFIYAMSLALAYPFALIMNQFIEIDLIFYIILLPTAAIGIIVPIIKADGQMARKYGQTLLMEGAIATIMSIILISIYSGVLKKGFQIELLLFTVIFIVFMLTYMVGKRLMKQRNFQKLLYTLEHAASQIRVRGAVALLLLFIIIAHLIETELIMGAFFAGTALSLFMSKKRSALMFKLDGMSYGFFIPIFFIMVGVNLDLSALSEFRASVPFILTLAGGFFVTQIIPAFIMAKVFGWKKALAGGILLSARLGETIATAQIGLSLGVITSADNAAIVTASIITSIISPLAYNLFSQEKYTHFDIYILGGSRVSRFLSERFKMHGLSCITIIQREEVIPDFEKKGLDFRHVEKLDGSVIQKLSIRTNDLFIILTESDKLNVELTSFLKDELHHSKIITHKQPKTKVMANAHEDMKLVDMDEIMANHVEDMIVRPDSISMLNKSFGDYRVEEIQITKGDVHRKMVKEIAFPPSGSLVLQKRNGEIFVPHGDTHLLNGDVLTVIGNATALAEFRTILEK